MGKSESERFDNLTTLSQKMTSDRVLEEEINMKFRDNFPEIFSFFRLFEKDKKELVEAEDISIYCCYESENVPNKDLIEIYLKSKGFKYNEYTFGIGKKNIEEIRNEFREMLLKINNNHDEMFFNITSGNFLIKEFIFSFAPEVDGRVYLLANTNDLIFLPEVISQNILDDQFNLEEVLMDSLISAEIKEIGYVDYELKPDIIPQTFLSYREIQDETIFFKKQAKNQTNYEILKLMKLNGIKISKDEKISPFLSKVIEGLYHSKNNIIRLIINNEDGIKIYMGLILSGNSLIELKDLINVEMQHFKKLLKASYPGLDVEPITESELSNILEFIKSKKYYGSIIGYKTEDISANFLKELENALWADQWGMMTIGESMSDIALDKLINDLQTEIDSILEKLPFELDELVELLASKKWKEYANISKLKIDFFNKLYKIKQYIEQHRNIGIFDTCNYIFTNDISTYNTIYSIFKSNYKSINHFWMPIKIITLDDVLMQFPKNFQLISVQRQGPTISNKLELFHTIYSSYRLAEFIFLPSQPLNNFDISIVPPFQTQYPMRILESFKKPIKLGIIKNSIRKENAFYMDYDAFTRHCLIMGSTGSGKTNTVMNILTRIRENDEQFPFLIIDPIKKEYRYLTEYFDDLEIYTTGKKVNPLMINLFEVPPFITYSQWVNELLEIISNAFRIWQPFREIIWNSLNDIYVLNGWREDKRGRSPTLKEFLPFAKLRIDCSDYNAHIRDGFKGSFENRIESLSKGTRALTFDCFSSRPSLEELLRKPIVIELTGLMSDDEKALVFNLLMKKLFLYQHYYGFSRNLRHITVIEEAHRLITVESRTEDRLDRSIRAKALDDFSDLLAEIRAYGEGLIISEQKPKELIRSALTNTNLKICHKLPSLDQILPFADSLNLSNEHLPFVTRLKPGECVIKIDEIDSPFYIQVDLAKDDMWGIEKEFTDEELKERLPDRLILEQIHYSVERDNRTKEYNLEISELIFFENGREKTIKNPSKEDCMKFPNFEYLLWKRLIDFYSKYDYCPNCLKIISHQENPEIFHRKNVANLKDQYEELFFKDHYCNSCKTVLEKINEINLPQFNRKIQKDDILNKIKLNFLYKWHKILAPSEFDSRSQNMLKEIKEEFNKILENL